MRRTFCVLLVLLQTSPAFADLFSLELPVEPARPRSTFLPPLASFVLPGFDQWWESQYESAGAYTGTAAAGVLLSARAFNRAQELKTDLNSRDGNVRDFVLGNQLYLAAGSFSAYHSFRSAVRTRQAIGEYGFLTHEETPDELLRAPFAFGELKKPTTWIPLVGTLAVAGVVAAQDGTPFRHNGFNGGDLAYGGAFSYLAGSHEEALFRGYLMPYLMQSWKNRFWSNSASAVLFAAAHIGSDNPFPWPQLIAGWYLGYVTQQNEWTLRQSIFLHTWYDMIVFSASFLHESRDVRYRNIFYLPTITF